MFGKGFVINQALKLLAAHTESSIQLLQGLRRMSATKPIHHSSSTIVASLLH